MSSVGYATLQVIPSLKGVKGNIESELGGVNADGVGKSVGGKFAGGIGTGLKVLAGGVVAREIFQVGAGFVKAAEESAAVTRQTDAVLKSMGNTAGVSAKQVAALSTELSLKSGVDDEVIQSAQNVLLTFGKVTNGIGAGNDVFDRGSKAALNMSAALKQDLQGATIQVGKALNDPIKGITALSRAGVSFTEQQKDQIRTLTESGNVLGAQKIILGELEKQFGGSAEANATASARMKVAFGNIQEQLGAFLLPIVEKVATFLANNLPAAMAFVGSVAQSLAPTFRAVGDVISTVFRAFKVLSGDDGAQGFGEIMDNLLGNSGKYVGLFRDLGTWIIKVAGFIGDNLKPILIGLGIALAALLSPIAVVVGALVLAYAKSETFRDIIAAVAAFLVDVVFPAIATFAAGVIATFSEIVTWVQDNWAQISEAIGHVIAVVQEIVGVWVDWFKTLWRAWGDDIANVVGTVWGFIQSTIENALAFVQGLIQTVLAVINGDWGKAWDGIKQALGAVWDQITNIVQTAWSLVQSVLGAGLSLLQELFRGAWDVIRSTVSGGIDAVVGFFTGMPGRLASAAGDLFGFVVSSFKGAINSVIRMWNGIKFPSLTIGGQDPLGAFGPSLPEVTIGGWDLPNIRELATGGIVDAVRGGVLARIGEGRNKEAVVPLSEQGLRPFATALASQLGSAGGSGGTTFNGPVTIVSDAVSPREVFDETLWRVAG